MPRADPSVCVVLHDVAPATWPACEKLLSAVDALGRVPVTLLVVPEYHHGKPIDMSPAFASAVEERLALGDEVAMHGCFHWDDLPVTSPSEWWRRRFYTAGEGEFAALGQRSARARLARGIETFRRLGWPLRGFVAPAWLLSAGTCAALSSFPFSYTSTRRRLYTLPDWRQHGTGSLIWSVGSAPRRWAFGMLNRWQLHRLRSAPLLRLGIHPVDAAYPDVSRFWMRALECVLASRLPLTKSAWLGVDASPCAA